MKNRIIVYNTEIGIPLNDQITNNNRAFNIPISSTVRLKLRQWDSDSIYIDSAASIINASSGQVRYIWNANDFIIPGQYIAWWEINSSGIIFESDEFSIIIATHAPGLETRTGAIYHAAKSYLPITWERLEESEHYGDRQLQSKVEIAKLSLLGVEILAEDEAAMDIRVANYIAKIAVISIIPAGKDYWASMVSSKTSVGTDESVSYPDRIEMLDQLHDQLVEEIAKERDDISELIDLPNIRRANSVPSVSDGTDEGYITPNPHTHFRDYGFPVRGNTLRGRNAVRGRFW